MAEKTRIDIVPEMMQKPLPMKLFLRSLGVSLVVILALLLLPGCVQLQTPDGLTFTRFSPFFNGQIGVVEVNTPDFTAKISGYRSEGAEMVGAVAEGVAKGLAKP